MPVTASVADRFVSKAEAARRIGCHVKAIDRMIRRRQLTVRQLPGATVRVSLADLERLAEESIRPAERSTD